ncbi:MAG: TM2 domain-containing protein, partial [Planctomycetota bacterium]
PGDSHSMIVGYLTWLIGFTGAHRFYYGKPVSGAIWFFTGGLFLIGWLVDFVLIPTMDREANMRFVRGQADYSLTWILFFVLGLFGVHRFYLGKWGTGLVYLLSGGLFGIGWLYDLLTLNDAISGVNYDEYRLRHG